MNNGTIIKCGIRAASLVNYVNRVLNLELDVHYQQVTVAMQKDGGRLKAAGKMGRVDFLNWVPTAAAVRARGKGLLCAQGTKSAADGGKVTCG